MRLVRMGLLTLWEWQVAVEELAAQQLRSTIMRWIADNPEVDLELKLLSDYLVEFCIGPTKMAFQVGTDERWRPQFMQSASELLAEYLTPINVWIEENCARDSFSITELLNHLAEHFRAARDQLLRGNASTEMTAKLAAELEQMMRATKKTKVSVCLMRLHAH